MMTWTMSPVTPKPQIWLLEEATPEVARRMTSRFSRWPEAVELDTARPWEATAADLAEVLGVAP